MSSNNQWSNKKSLLLQLQKLWDKGLLLEEVLLATTAHCCRNSCEKGSENSSENGSELFPKRLTLKSPNSKDLSQDYQAVRQWVSDMQSLSGFRVVYKTINHRVIGENTLPAEVWIDQLDTAINLLGQQKTVATFVALLNDTQLRIPELVPWVKQYPLKLITLAESWNKLLVFLVWRQQTSQPSIYLRQVSLTGIDSKFLEKHRGTLSQLLDIILPASEINTAATGVKYFEQRYGFVSKPERIRFRILDSTIQLSSFEDQDIEITAHDFQALSQDNNFLKNISRVFVTENEINFLAFPPMENSLAIFGAGYGFKALANARWLSKVTIFYWGDIDTHGFAILDQLRSHFYHVESLLMDETTLLTHQEFWGTEANQETRTLPHLTPSETRLYQNLVDHQYKDNLRLEQERIPFTTLAKALFAMTAG